MTDAKADLILQQLRVIALSLAVLAKATLSTDEESKTFTDAVREIEEGRF